MAKLLEEVAWFSGLDVPRRSVRLAVNKQL
jgi:hypothetical protein